MKWVYIIFFLFGIKNTDFLIAQTKDLSNYTYDELAKLINKENDQKKRIELSKQYLSKAKAEKDFKNVIDGYYYLGENLNNFELNLKCSDSAIAVAKSKRLEDLSYLYRLRGDMYFYERRFKDALNCYLIAKQDKNQALEFIDRIDFKIGAIKISQEKYEEAVLIYKKCEADAKKGNFKEYIRYVLGLSELYNRINKIDFSDKYIKRGLIECTNRKNNYYIPYFISNRGKNLYKKGQYISAIKDLKKYLFEIKKNNDFSNYAENCFYIGKCYDKLGKEKFAVEYYQKVDSIFKEKNDIYLITISSYNHLIEYYKKNGDYKKAIYYSDQFIKADKKLDKDYKYITENLNKTYNIEQANLAKEDLVKLQNRKNLSYLFVVILILSITILLYFFSLNKKELKKQRKLFEEYRRKKEENILKPQIKKTITSIDKKVVLQITKCLEQFEREQWFLKNEYTVEMLAFEFKTNSSYLSKVINEIKDSNFSQYINNLRINYIIEKLEKEKKYLNFTIQALSELSGYNSVQTFTRAFVSHTKMNPSSFIKELKTRQLNK